MTALAEIPRAGLVVAAFLRFSMPENMQPRTQMLRLDLIVPYSNNPRKNDGAVEAVARSIQEFGFLQPIVVAVHEPRAERSGALDELPHALIAPRRIDMDLEHRAWRSLEAHGHRVKAEQDFRSHGRW